MDPKFLMAMLKSALRPGRPTTPSTTTTTAFYRAPMFNLQDFLAASVAKTSTTASTTMAMTTTEPPFESELPVSDISLPPKVLYSPSNSTRRFSIKFWDEEPFTGTKKIPRGMMNG